MLSAELPYRRQIPTTTQSARSALRAHMKINVPPRDESMFVKTVFPSKVGVRDKQPLPSKSRFFFSFFSSNPLEAHVALICHSEKVPWSVKWPVDDLCCRAAAGTCCPRGPGAEESKSASWPSVSIDTLLASPFSTSKPLNTPLKNWLAEFFASPQEVQEMELYVHQK